MENKILKLFVQRGFTVFVILLSFLSFPSWGNAATLLATPSSKSVNVGGEFNLTVKVNTASKYINNAEGVVSYSKDLVEVVSISKSNSVFNLWINEPANSKSTGTISFNGGVKTPGYLGSGGTIFSVKFKAKKAGTANFSFSNHAIRENDGMGTNILTGQSGASVEIKTAPKKEEAPKVVKTPEVVKTLNLEKLVVYSDTHPDQEKWYSLKDAQFTWDNPKEAIASSTLIDTSSGSIPSTKSTLLISNKNINNIGDGIHYFHVNYKTKGGWASPTHYMVKIDTEAPKNLLVSVEKDSNDKYFLNLKADDELSGVDHYNIIIPGQDVIVVSAIGGCATYSLPDILEFGKNSLEVQVVDMAGNSKTTNTEITIDTLTKPEVLSYSMNAMIGEPIIINGKTHYSNLDTFVYVISPNGKVLKYVADVNDKGEFTINTDKVTDKGEFTFWIQIYSEDGIKTAKSNYYKTDTEFSLWNYVLDYPIFFVSGLFFIFSLIILILAIYLLRLHKNKVVDNKKQYL